MTKKFMHHHPLRSDLHKEDWKRIQDAIENDNVDDATQEEIEAAHDVFYDVIAGQSQTHYGVTTLQ